MNIQKKLQEQQEELKKIIEEINQLQQALNLRNQDALRVDGAIKTLQDLIKEEEVKEDKTGDK